MNWDEAVTFALTLPDTGLGRTYGQSSVKIRSNGRAFLLRSRGSDSSFGLVTDPATLRSMALRELTSTPSLAITSLAWPITQ